MNEFHVWTSRDHHSRAFATLTTARSARITETLGLRDASRSTQCTVCHAPMHEVSADLRASAADSLSGVSCESCHNAAEPWLRAHTRNDYTHAQRVLAGMRELTTASGRANACVACHQTIAPDLLRAGHPELIFELDGQCASQPRHWAREDDLPGPKLWLAGQAAAFREMSWQLMQIDKVESRQIEAWQGLAWLIALVASDSAEKASLEPSAEKYRVAHRIASDLVNEVSRAAWDDQKTRSVLSRLLKTAPDFRESRVPPAIQVRRAERLVMALDRLSAGLKDRDMPDAWIDKLFAAVQDRFEFSPERFAALLEDRR